MTSLFNPDVQSEVRPEQSTSFSPAGTALGAVGSLLGTVASSQTRPREGDLERAALDQYTKDVAIAQSLSRKDPNKSRLKFRQATVQAMRSGLSLDVLDDIAMAQTGQSLQVASFSQEQIAAQEFLGNHEVATPYIALARRQAKKSGAAVSEEEILERAYNSYNLDLTASQFQASTQKEFDTFYLPGLRHITMTSVQADLSWVLENPEGMSKITSSDIEQRRLSTINELMKRKSQFQTGPGQSIRTEGFDKLIDDVNDMYNLAKSAAEAGRNQFAEVNKTQQDKALSRVLLVLEEQTERGELSPLNSVIVGQMVNNPEALIPFLAEMPEGQISDFYEGIGQTISRLTQTDDPTSETDLASPSPDVVSDTASKMSAHERVAAAQRAGVLLKVTPKTPEQAKIWADSAMMKAETLRNNAAEGEWVNNQSYSQAFGKEFRDGLEYLRTTDPALAEQVEGMALEAIDSSIIVLGKQITDTELFTISSDGSIALSEDFEDQIVGKLSNEGNFSASLIPFPNLRERLPSVMEMVGSVYGVDKRGRPRLDKALADKGAQLPSGTQQGRYSRTVLNALSNTMTIFGPDTKDAFYNLTTGLESLLRQRDRIAGLSPEDRFSGATPRTATRESVAPATAPVPTPAPNTAPLVSPLPVEPPGTGEILQRGDKIFDGEEAVVERLLMHEGRVTNDDGQHVAYLDSEGIKTIGYGHKWLEGDPEVMSEEEAKSLFRQDYISHRDQIRKKLPYFDSLPDVVKGVLTDMAFNLGVEGLLGFKEMLKGVEAGDWNVMTREMRNSLWFKQTDTRAKRLIREIQQLRLDN